MCCRRYWNKVDECFAFTYFILLLLFSVFFIIWIGLFFGLNYPEIVIHDTYYKTLCTVAGLSITSAYNCDYSYSNCGSAYNYPHCRTLKSTLNGRNPALCENNSQECAPSVSICNYGYVCCMTQCQTCTSCSGSGKSTNCHSYSCNCYCAIPNYNSIGNVECQIYYTTVLLLNFIPKITSNTEHNAINDTIKTPFYADLNAANSDLNKYTIGQTLTCYYNPQNAESVVLSNALTPWKLAVMGVFAALAGICLLTFAIMFAYDMCRFYECAVIQYIRDIYKREPNPPEYSNSNPPTY